jgi:hypothetical protein
MIILIQRREQDHEEGEEHRDEIGVGDHPPITTDRLLNAPAPSPH